MASSLITALTVTTPPAGAAPTLVTHSEQGGLLDALAKIPDPRNPCGIRYPLSAVLTVAVCAVMAGASTFAAITDWLHDLDEHAQTRLGFNDRVPAGTTMWRLLIRLDPTLLAGVLASWLHTRAGQPGPLPRRYRRVIAVDGKTLRGARLGGGRQVHLLSALDTATGIVIAQVVVDTKSNEITSFAPLLDAVEAVLGTLSGVLFTADALHTQTGHADEVTARNAHLRAGQGQPADPVQTVETAALGADPGRGPDPRAGSRPP